MDATDRMKAAAGTDPNDYVWKANREVPASLISRLAEAADGMRTGKPVYFVAELEPDLETGHDVIGSFATPEAVFDHQTAKEAVLSGEYLIFGPFQTKDDPYYRPKDIEKVVIYPRGKSPIVLDGMKFDCVFWSLSAVDKFLIPYYTSMGDLEKASRVRKDFIKPKSIAGIHIPGSDIVNDNTSTPTDITLADVMDRVGVYLVREKKFSDGGGGPIFIPL
jgi:hypothetical protein